VSIPTSVHSRAGLLALLGLLVGVVVWLWPIGFGGKMPVGGDVTQFSIGLMAVLARHLQAARLPVWNDLWGYGFPGLGESQMGVYYPPHWLLYGLLPLEAAYTASLVVHTIWGALGVYWAARKFGIAPKGAALAGFAWTACGFFVIHVPHQWGYTVGSWMPWAWGLAWLIASGEATVRTPMLLSLVLTLQLLPGHFQLAFCTQTGVVLLALGSLARRPGQWRPVAVTALAIAATLPLAALQLWPTYRLARLAASRRDFPYLSGFAATPVHLINYVAPGLLHRSPLWRPLAWDPFHTSPEEHLSYVGLVPLFLALMAIWEGVRRDRAVRTLAVVAFATLFFSLGPFSPGFEVWSSLPGFSFFRAPARWSLATALALSLLAGKGFDAWRSWPRPGRRLAGFALLSAVQIGLVVGTIELALGTRGSPAESPVVSVFERGMDWMPWPRVRGRRLDPSFRELVEAANQPQSDVRIPIAHARQGIRVTPPAGWTFTRQRLSIYRLELAGTGALLLALLIVARLAGRGRTFEVALVVVTALDLWSLGWHRPYDLGPIRSLIEQSPVLERLERQGRGTRTLDTARNLPMVAGAAPISSYRTLDLPCVPALTAMALAPLGRPESEPMIVAAFRATGATVRVLDPFESAPSSPSGQRLPGWADREIIRDPALAGWLYGTDWVAEQGPRGSTFTLWRPVADAAQAWFIASSASESEELSKSSSSRPGRILNALAGAEPVPVKRTVPERLEATIDARGPGILIVAQLADPQWKAKWTGPSETQAAEVRRVFEGPLEVGWQAIDVPGPGRWTLQMEYDARDVRQGLAISTAAWLFWALGWVVARQRAKSVPEK
jgi:hypothetical protein